MNDLVAVLRDLDARDKLGNADGNVHDLAIRIMEELVTIFRGLDARGKLDDVRNVFDKRHAHAGHLEIVLDANDDDAIKQALE